jgi:hypothetical protein
MLLFVPNVALPDEHTSMMNGLRHAILEDNGLKAALQEVLNSECKHVIKLVLALTKKTISVHAAQECLALKDMAGFFSSRVSSSLAAFRMRLRAYCTRHSSRLHLRPYSPTKTLLLIRTPWLLESLTICVTHCWNEQK